MRISIQWCILLVALLFIGQAMVLVYILQPPPDSLFHSESSPSLKSPSPSKTDDQCPSFKEQSSLDYESMAYLYDKFRVAATEVKRQVLKRKGEQVPEVPPKVKPACKSNFIAATYNLWNINPPWPIRAQHIATLLKALRPHVVGLQEIRLYEGRPQLQFLSDLLGSDLLPHSVYERVQSESVGGEEGLGILSQYPILESSAISFENTNRKCLRALIDTPHGKINFFVTHFSLSDLEQCSHALVLWEYMNSFPSDIPQIMVGDMNTYFDFEWPMDLLTRGLSKFMLSQFNPCSAVLQQKLQESNTAKESNDQLSLPFHTLKDVWEEIYPAVPKNLKITPNERWWGTWPSPSGHTFSNYGDQDPSRTDRMYFYSPDSKNGTTLQLCDVELFGDQPIPGQSKKLFPSDHKGVAGHFILK